MENRTHRRSRAGPLRLPALSILLCATLAVGSGAPTNATAGSPGGVFVPIVFSTPETGLALGGTAILFRDVDLPGPGDHQGTDTLTVVGFYTTEDQYLASLSGQLHFAGGLWKVANTTTLSEFPRDFYGIGNRSSEADETSYTPVRARNSLRLKRWLGGAWYGGGRWDALSLDIEDVEAGSKTEEYYQERDLALDVDAHGIGLEITRDTRSASFFPTTGSKTELSAVTYPEGLGAEQDFTLAELDHRFYWPLGEDVVLAVQALAEYASDEAPLPLLPQLGGSSLRGFYEGRYVDTALVSAQAEARFPITPRWRGALFLGAGEVAPRFSDLSRDHLKYAGGCGVRYVLQPEARIHLRLDFAYGQARGDAEGADGLAVYFNVGEAF